MLKRLLTTCLILGTALIAGCGSSDNYNGYVNQYVTHLPYALSGDTGAIELHTILAGVNAQTIEIIESNTIPDEVTELRFTGFNSEGVDVYSAVKPKAGIVTLEQVPVEVVSLRVELLARGLTVGGLATPIQVKTGETATITDPVYVFPGASTGTTNTSYGSFASEANTIYESDSYIDFARIAAAVGVTRVEANPKVSYQVTKAGDYLATYSMNTRMGENYLGQAVDPIIGDALEFVRFNSQGTQVDHLYWAATYVDDGFTFQVVVSLNAGDSVALRVPTGGETLKFGPSTFTLIRLGDSSDASLPTSSFEPGSNID